MYKHIYILFFLFSSLTISAQTINGSITDNNKEILPGANILIKGENFGVSSDNNGKYLLELKANRSVIIEVSFIDLGQKASGFPC